MKSIAFLFPFLCLCLSCGNPAHEKMLQEAFSFHEKSLTIRENLEKILQQGVTLTDEQQSELRDFLEDWDQSFVEVPGFEHTHDHDHDHEGHDHSHHHAHKAPELTPEQHLQLQKHLYEQLVEVYSRVQK
ncbi:MAG: hypothetical protein JJU34_01000 [Lunatimonas sp.]|uniref:hypothetical protein n=1 Tax=Lunatimonas sp. TaxID=2060141 RepID=UPI00263B7B67|nr:hypothetical protein [Lunatimonas sp.]MCC5935833.1 hypothetical protein [Lunatimonas sp.]